MIVFLSQKHRQATEAQQSTTYLKAQGLNPAPAGMEEN
jgi:hypothetical protein